MIIPSSAPDIYQNFEEWQDAWYKLRDIDQILPWAVGDLYNYGADKFGEMASQVLDPDEINGHFTKGSIAQYAFVSRQWPLLSRLNLPWSYHQATASLPMENRLTLMQHCIDHGIKRAELRQMVKELNGGNHQNPPATPDDINFELTVENHQKDRQIAELESKVEALQQAAILPEGDDQYFTPDDLPAYALTALGHLENALVEFGYTSVTVFADGSVRWNMS